jgi:hypothetical protein
MARTQGAPDPWEVFKNYIYEHLGLAGVIGVAVVGAAIYVWTHWDDVKKWPGVASTLKYLSREAVPQADMQRFSIAVADLGGDTERGETKRLIIRLLRDLDGVQVLSLPRIVSIEGTIPEEREREGHNEARDHLIETKADILIWGSVLHYGSESKPDLYLTTAADQIKSSKQYTVEIGEEYRLPKVFLHDLSDVLRLAITMQVARFQDEDGKYVADRMLPFISRIRNLLRSKATSSWDAHSLATTRLILADSLLTAGIQSGDNQLLEDALSGHRLTLKDVSRERAPLAWAALQNSLGNALLVVGSRESDTSRVVEAVAAYNRTGRANSPTCPARLGCNPG